MNRSHGLYMQRSRAVHAVGSLPTAINCGVTLSHQQLAWYLVGGTPQSVCDHSNLRLYLRGTVKFAVSFSYKELRSYLLPQVWFICYFPWLQPETGSTGVVLHAWLR
ncbi:unnamed protein product [Sphenostylis stenocarpa]|uniref:Uncharacterized protein n=1 Tax=Sphenostylis stenocarpa TaxID=92480 RepID=A0AA86TD70_9FABA|nr:unnamed protein product [Sphenostylis stenocarpa]